MINTKCPTFNSPQDFSYPESPSLPPFDLSPYRQVRLIASSNHKVFLYQSNDNRHPHQVAVKEIFVE